MGKKQKGRCRMDPKKIKAPRRVGPVRQRTRREEEKTADGGSERRPENLPKRCKHSV